MFFRQISPISFSLHASPVSVSSIYGKTDTIVSAQGKKRDMKKCAGSMAERSQLLFFVFCTVYCSKFIISNGQKQDLNYFVSKTINNNVNVIG